jgi:hypothetical protein
LGCAPFLAVPKALAIAVGFPPLKGGVCFKKMSVTTTSLDRTSGIFFLLQKQDLFQEITKKKTFPSTANKDLFRFVLTKHFF